MSNAVKTLQQAIQHFSSYDNCKDFLVALRWPDGVRCPRCGSDHVVYLEKARAWKCYGKHDHAKFTLKTGTVMEDSPIGLDKWLPVIWLAVNCKNGVSSWEIHRALGVTQKTAWFLLHRVRLAMQDASAPKLSGEIEADETFIGGKVTNMHRRARRTIQAKNDGQWGKTVVLGLLQREGDFRAAVAPNRRKHVVHSHIAANVAPGSTLYTDEFNSYENLPPEFTRELVNHLQAYVSGRVHVNGVENFWSLLKRTLKGTYISVDPAHLFRYLDEQTFRYNNRKDMDDYGRFKLACSRIVGKRLTYAELIGKEAETQASA